MPDNLERRARAICASDLDAAQAGLANRAAAVDRYWPVVAAEIARGDVHNLGFQLPPDFAVLKDEYQRLTRSNSNDETDGAPKDCGPDQ